MFGQSSSSSFGGGGGFGQSNNNQQQTFGFGQSQPQQPQTFGSSFQQQSTFGQPPQSQFNQQQPQFGASATPATSQTVNNGTGNPVWAGTVDRDGTATVGPTCTFQAISAMPVYKNWSIEELRAQDYVMGKKVGSQPQTTTGFGQPASTSTFGASTGFGGTSSSFNPPKPASGFGFGASNPTPAPSTSLFGSSNTTGFGQPAQTSTFGQPAQPSTSGFGATAASTGFGFGAKPAATTGFGALSTGFGQPAQPSTGMFGSTAPTQPSGGFGFGQQQQPAQTTTFGQPAQHTSMFGQKPATTGFGATTTTTGFGQPAHPATGFGFGQQQQQQPAQPAASAFGFGSKPATTPAFGAPPATQSTGFGTGGGLFGNTQAAKPTTSLFGTTPAQPASTFGQQPAATGGLFGNTTTTAPAPTTSLFGQSQPAPGFGQSQPTTSLFGNTSTAAKPTTSLFGNTATTQPTNTFGFGQGQPATNTGTSLFGGNTAQLTTSLFNQQPQVNNQVLHASLNKNPYGVNPLLKKSLDKKPNEQQPVNLTAPTPEKKLPTLTPTFKVTPRSSSQIKLRGVAPQSSGPTLAESHRNQITGKKTLHILDGSPRDVVALGLDSRFTPRRSVKRLDIDDASVFLSTPQKEIKSAVQTPKAVTFRSGVEDDLDVLKSPSKSQPTSPKKSPKKESGYVIRPSMDELMNMSDKELRAVENFTISIPIYGSVTFLEKVDLLSVSPTGDRKGITSIPGEIVVIASQTVTVYPDENVKPPQGEGLNVPAVISLLSCWSKDRNTGQIIDNESDPRFDRHLKKLMNMEDTTFIDFEIIRGIWKFRVEHFTRYGLVDDSDDEQTFGQVVPSKVDESELLDDTFMLGNRDTSILKGEVEELLDESEPEEFEDVSADSEELDNSVSGSSSGYESGSESESTGSASTITEELNGSKPNYEIEERGGSSAEDDDLLTPVPQTLQSAMSTVDRAVVARNVQTMKANLFQSPKKFVELPKPPVSFSFKDEDNDTPEEVKAAGEKRSFDQEAPTVVASRTEFSSLQIIKNGSPQKYVKQSDLIIPKVDLRKPIPLKDSTCFGNEKLFADASFHMGRSFRVCFGPNGTIVIPKSISKVKVMYVDEALHSQNNSMRSSILLECVLANTKVFVTSPSREDPHDEIQVDPAEEVTPDNQTVVSTTILPSTYSQFSKSRCPKSVLNPNFNFETICQGMSAVFAEEEVQLWKLASDLWDRIFLDPSVMSYTPEQFQLIENALRRTRVSQWLKDVCDSVITGELAKSGKDGIEKVFLNLSGNRVAAAVEACLKNNDFRLACVLAQLPSPVAISAPGGLISPNGIPGRKGMDRNNINHLIHQINYWKESKTSNLIDPKYLAVWTLLSGAVDRWDESVIRPDLDWKRTFGLFLWYSDGGSMSLSDSIIQYAGNLDAVAKPLSKHNSELYDLAFHLLQLLSDPDYSLEVALNPLTHTDSPLEYRLSWTLGMLLTKTAKVKQFKDVMFDSICGDGIDEADGRSSTQDTQALHFISQLIAAGLWKWAIFVATFLSFHTSREATIRDILNRHYPPEDCSGSVEKDDDFQQDSEDYTFLTQKLYINPQWIHESRALKATYEKDLYQHIVSLIDANLLNKAHVLVVTQYAPAKLLSNDTVMLSKLLKYLESSGTVTDWKRGGGFLKSYLELLVEFPDPYVTLGPDAEKLTLVKSLLVLLSDDLLNHWKLQSHNTTVDQKQTLVIFFKEAAMYLSTLLQSLGTEKISLDILCNLPLRVDDRAKFVTKAAMGLMMS